MIIFWDSEEFAVFKKNCFAIFSYKYVSDVGMLATSVTVILSGSTGVELDAEPGTCWNNLCTRTSLKTIPLPLTPLQHSLELRCFPLLHVASPSVSQLLCVLTVLSLIRMTCAPVCRIADIGLMFTLAYLQTWFGEYSIEDIKHACITWAVLTHCGEFFVPCPACPHRVHCRPWCGSRPSSANCPWGWQLEDFTVDIHLWYFLPCSMSPNEVSNQTQ